MYFVKQKLQKANYYRMACSLMIFSHVKLHFIITMSENHDKIVMMTENFTCENTKP